MSDVSIYRPPQTPTMPFADMAQLAEAIARSGMFGIKTRDQALALMAISQAEGRHPALAARDYHIINGSPSKKSEAMLRDFFSAGGKVEWHELTDEAADATFSHPMGGTVRIRWDAARVKQAGLANLHNKYPRAMKRSRCVSEGVRTVWPLATSGMYVPEEFAEFSPAQRAEPTAAKSNEIIDAKTGEAFDLAGLEIIDAETGEVFDRIAIIEDARAFAEQGLAALLRHLRALDDGPYDIVKPLVGTKENPGELRSIARGVDASREAQPHPPPGTPATPATAAAAPSDARQPAGDTEISDLLGGDARPAASNRFNLPRTPVAKDWQAFSDFVDAKLDDGVPGRVIRNDNDYALRQLKAADVDLYDAIQGRLGK